MPNLPEAADTIDPVESLMLDSKLRTLDEVDDRCRVVTHRTGALTWRVDTCGRESLDCRLLDDQRYACDAAPWRFFARYCSTPFATETRFGLIDPTRNVSTIGLKVPLKNRGTPLILPASTFSSPTIL